MFIGHFALGFAAKRAAPRVSLGILFLAAQLADVLWPILVLAGIETVRIAPGITVVTPLDFVSYPYSHSLLSLCVLGAALGAVCALWRKNGARTFVVIALLVVSHWLLDYITHRPDMPLTMGGPERVGLGLWNSVAGTLAVELPIFGVGLLIYTRSTAARDRIGSIGLWSLAAFLLVIYLANMVGPPPPSPAAVAWAAQAMWLLVWWGYWVDAHRVPVVRRA